VLNQAINLGIDRSFRIAEAIDATAFRAEGEGVFDSEVEEVARLQESFVLCRCAKSFALVHGDEVLVVAEEGASSCLNIAMNSSLFFYHGLERRLLKETKRGLWIVSLRLRYVRGP
jgi:hypothetical protein